MPAHGLVIIVANGEPVMGTSCHHIDNLKSSSHILDSYAFLHQNFIKTGLSDRTCKDVDKSKVELLSPIDDGTVEQQQLQCYKAKVKVRLVIFD